jgi:hypothetical protein
MYRQAKMMILVNVLLILFFVLANYFVYVSVNREGYFTRSWNPLVFTTDTYAVVPAPYTIVANLPFYIFWITIAVNTYFIIILQKGKETKSFG